MHLQRHRQELRQALPPQATGMCKKKTLVQRKTRAGTTRKADPGTGSRKAALETEMSSGTLPIDELTAKSLRISELIEQIDEASMRWLELSDI